MPPLLVIDGDSLAHRAYHATPSSVRDGAGRPANMVSGFTSMLRALVTMEEPRAVLACWDSIGTPTWRHAVLPEYQSGRDFPDDLVRQLDLLPVVVAAAGFANAKQGGLEADDFLAAAAVAEAARGGQTVVVTSDRDAFQLVTDSVTVLRPLKGVSQTERIDPAGVRERYGVDPAQVPDFIALRGDPSDRIPGARGVGPKKAADILARYGSLDAALADGRFAEEAAALRDFQHIARMRADAPIPDLPDMRPDWEGCARLLAGWGLTNLAARVSTAG